MKKRVYKYHTLIKFIEMHVTVCPVTAAESTGLYSSTIGGYCGVWYRAGLLEKVVDAKFRTYRKTKAWTRESAVKALKEYNASVHHKSAK